MRSARALLNCLERAAEVFGEGGEMRREEARLTGGSLVRGRRIGEGNGAHQETKQTYSEVCAPSKMAHETANK